MSFHIWTPESKSKIQISISVRCFEELVQYGAQDVLQREYGPYIVDPEPGYNFSVLVNLDELPAEPGMLSSCPKMSRTDQFPHWKMPKPTSSP